MKLTPVQKLECCWEMHSTHTMMKDKYMVIDESKLEKLLVKAYEEGWYGSKELASEAASKIIRDFKNESRGSAPVPKKKRAVKKKVRDGVWGTGSYTIDRPSDPAVQTFTTVGGEQITVEASRNPNSNDRVYMDVSGNVPDSMRYGHRRRRRAEGDNIQAHMDALDAAMMSSMGGVPPSPTRTPDYPQASEGVPSPSPLPYTPYAQASQEAVDDFNAWVGVDPGEEAEQQYYQNGHSDGPEETLE